MKAGEMNNILPEYGRTKLALYREEEVSVFIMHSAQFINPYNIWVSNHVNITWNVTDDIETGPTMKFFQLVLALIKEELVRKKSEVRRGRFTQEVENR